MNALNAALHPVALVPVWLSAVGDGWDAHFSRYIYTPQSIEDRRIFLRVPLAEITHDWLDEQLSQLGENEELAFHSTLTSGRRIRHIPMVDFAVRSCAVQEMAHWADRHLGIKLQLFDSGRSYHAYGLHPVSATDWVRLMGLQLLGNLPNQPPMVDSRWIGHRLMAGYSALRWSKNTRHYTGLPTLVDWRHCNDEHDG